MTKVMIHEQPQNNLPGDYSDVTSECYIAQTNYPALNRTVSLLYLSRQSFESICAITASHVWQPVALFRVRQKTTVDQLISQALKGNS